MSFEYEKFKNGAFGSKLSSIRHTLIIFQIRSIIEYKCFVVIDKLR